MTTQATGPRRTTAPPTARRRSQELRNLPAALLFVLPAGIGFVVFFLWPALRGSG